jgi:sortase B
MNQQFQNNQYNQQYNQYTQNSDYMQDEYYIPDEEYYIPDGEYKKPKKKRNLLKTVFEWTLIFACLAVLVYCSWEIYSTLNKVSVSDDVISSIMDEDDEKSYFNLDWSKLKETYPEIVAWIYIPNTGINYPVVQSSQSQEYYLEHGPYMEPNEMGAIFISPDASSDFSDDNTLIYGHSVQYYGGMFTGLNRYLTQEHYDENPYIYLLTPTATYRAEIRLFANTKEGTNYYLTSLGNWNQDILQWQLDNAMHTTPSVEVASGDHMITLSTCDLSDGGVYTETRYVLQAKLVYYLDKVEYTDSTNSEFVKRFGQFLKDSVSTFDTGKDDSANGEETETETTD